MSSSDEDVRKRGWTFVTPRGHVESSDDEQPKNSRLSQSTLNADHHSDQNSSHQHDLELPIPPTTHGRKNSQEHMDPFSSSDGSTLVSSLPSPAPVDDHSGNPGIPTGDLQVQRQPPLAVDVLRNLEENDRMSNDSFEVIPMLSDDGVISKDEFEGGKVEMEPRPGFFSDSDSDFSKLPSVSDVGSGLEEINEMPPTVQNESFPKQGTKQEGMNPTSILTSSTNQRPPSMAENEELDPVPVMSRRWPTEDGGFLLVQRFRKLEPDSLSTISSSISDFSSVSAAGRNFPQRQMSESFHEEDEGNVSDAESDGGSTTSNTTLPVNMTVRNLVPGVPQYLHRRDDRFNSKLSLLVVMVLTAGVSLGIGHFIGSSQMIYHQRSVEGGQVNRLRSLQDELVTCMSKRKDLSKKLIDEKKHASSCGAPSTASEQIEGSKIEIGKVSDKTTSGSLSISTGKTYVVMADSLMDQSQIKQTSCEVCLKVSQKYSEFCNTKCFTNPGKVLDGGLLVKSSDNLDEEGESEDLKFIGEVEVQKKESKVEEEEQMEGIMSEIFSDHSLNVIEDYPATEEEKGCEVDGKFEDRSEQEVENDLKDVNMEDESLTVEEVGDIALSSVEEKKEWQEELLDSTLPEQESFAAENVAEDLPIENKNMDEESSRNVETMDSTSSHKIWQAMEIIEGIPSVEEYKFGDGIVSQHEEKVNSIVPAVDDAEVQAVAENIDTESTRDVSARDSDAAKMSDFKVEDFDADWVCIEKKGVDCTRWILVAQIEDDEDEATREELNVSSERDCVQGRERESRQSSHGFEEEVDDIQIAEKLEYLEEGTEDDIASDLLCSEGGDGECHKWNHDIDAEEDIQVDEELQDLEEDEESSPGSQWISSEGTDGEYLQWNHNVEDNTEIYEDRESGEVDDEAEDNIEDDPSEETERLVEEEEKSKKESNFSSESFQKHLNSITNLLKSAWGKVENASLDFLRGNNSLKNAKEQLQENIKNLGKQVQDTWSSVESVAVDMHNIHIKPAMDLVKEVVEEKVLKKFKKDAPSDCKKSGCTAKSDEEKKNRNKKKSDAGGKGKKEWKMNKKGQWVAKGQKKEQQHKKSLWRQNKKGEWVAKGHHNQVQRGKKEKPLWKQSKKGEWMVKGNTVDHLGQVNLQDQHGRLNTKEEGEMTQDKLQTVVVKPTDGLQKVAKKGSFPDISIQKVLERFDMSCQGEATCVLHQKEDAGKLLKELIKYRQWLWEQKFKKDVDEVEDFMEELEEFIEEEDIDDEDLEELKEEFEDMVEDMEKTAKKFFRKKGKHGGKNKKAKEDQGKGQFKEERKDIKSANTQGDLSITLDPSILPMAQEINTTSISPETGSDPQTSDSEANFENKRETHEPKEVNNEKELYQRKHAGFGFQSSSDWFFKRAKDREIKRSEDGDWFYKYSPDTSGRWFFNRGEDREHQREELNKDVPNDWYYRWMQGRRNDRTGVTVWDMYKWFTDRFAMGEDLRHFDMEDQINWFLRKP